MANKDFDKQQKQQPQAGQPAPGGGRKNEEEVGEPVQLNEDMQKQQGQQPKPGMGQKEAQPAGKPQGGGQHQGGNR